MWQIYDRVLASGRVETLVSLTLITAAAPGERLVLLTDRHYVSARSVSDVAGRSFALRCPLLPEKQIETVSRRGVLPGAHLHTRLLL
jgi:hypothetical protein